MQDLLKVDAEIRTLQTDGASSLVAARTPTPPHIPPACHRMHGTHSAAARVRRKLNMSGACEVDGSEVDGSKPDDSSEHAATASRPLEHGAAPIKVKEHGEERSMPKVPDIAAVREAAGNSKPQSLKRHGLDRCSIGPVPSACSVSVLRASLCSMVHSAPKSIPRHDPSVRSDERRGSSTTVHVSTTYATSTPPPLRTGARTHA